MIIYKVTGSSVLVRQLPSPDARVVNVVGPEKFIYVAGDENGWLRTTGGNYVFKTSNLEPQSDPEVLNTLNTKIRLRSATRIIDDGNEMEMDGNTIPYTDTEAEGIGTQSTQNTADSAPTNSDTNQAQVATADDSVKLKEVIVIDPNKEYEIDDGNGGKKKVKASELGLDKANNGSQIISGPDSDGNVTVQTADGKYVTVNAADAKVGNPTSAGGVSGITYNEFEKRELEMLQKQSNAIANELQAMQSGNLAAFNAALNIEDGNARQVFGLPYQFLPTTDLRPPKTGGTAQKTTSYIDESLDIERFGRKYKEKIAARAPLLVMQPGEAIFLRGYTNDDKNAISNVLTFGGDNDTVDKIINGNGGEYYSFRLANEEYYRTVNDACRATAIFLGVDNVQVPNLSGSGSKEDAGMFGKIWGDAVSQRALGGFNWQLASKQALQLSYYTGAVTFYINSDSQVQENINNSSRQSQLASKISGISDQAMEAMFIMGGLQADLASSTGIGASTDINNKQNNLSGDDAGGKGLFHSIVGNITSLLAGGRMYFPEIWADSQFGRSYNVTIKLDSPDCDALSIYLNIFVPLIHIMAFCLPRCAGDNTYISPFLVRAFYKSMFHIDMGIVQSCDIVKGDQGCWTQDGLPTQITVQLSIKDLYSVMTQSMGKSNNTILSNPAQLDYLANLCGLNIAPANITRTLQLWWMLKGTNRVLDTLVSIPTRVITNAYAIIQNFGSPSRWRMT